MSPLMRAEDLAAEHGVCLSEDADCPGVYESETMPRDKAIDLRDALGRGAVHSWSEFEAYVRVDLSAQMAEWKLGEFGAGEPR